MYLVLQKILCCTTENVTQSLTFRHYMNSSFWYLFWCFRFSLSTCMLKCLYKIFFSSLYFCSNIFLSLSFYLYYLFLPSWWINVNIIYFTRYFERQLDLAEQTSLPMFLHCRNASSDLIEIVSRHRHRISGAVVSESSCCTLFTLQAWINTGWPWKRLLKWCVN